ncbi:MAG TPA: hypothetical protein VMV86_00475, partial [Methanosarcinales archaeon]|nr:hypothetical protein [Methanosarcinales archaeon]
SIIETFQNRIFLADLDDKSKVQYSKIRFEGRPVEFNDSLVINLNPKGGDITGMKVLDDKLIMWKSDSMFYLSGTGPNNLGQQNNYIEPEQISADVGCVDKNSLVVTPFGIMFKSRKGIYLISRSMEVLYIGAPVESFNSLTMSSAIVSPNNNQVRFTTTTGECLVYNHFLNQWSVFTNHTALSAVLLNSTYYYLRTDSHLYKENLLSFTDNGSPIKLRVETGWLSLAGVQGFKRMYRMVLLGTWKNSHKLRVRTAYNYIDAYIHEKVIDSSEVVSEVLYGDDSPYGNGVYGGEKDLYQMTVEFKTQKCQSIKILIEDLQSLTGEGLELSHMLFIVGVKENEFKLGNSKTFGVS